MGVLMTATAIRTARMIRFGSIVLPRILALLAICACLTGCEIVNKFNETVDELDTTDKVSSTNTAGPVSEPTVEPTVEPVVEPVADTETNSPPEAMPKTRIETPFGSTLAYWGESNEDRAAKAQYLRDQDCTYIVTGLAFNGNKDVMALGPDLLVWVAREDKVRLLPWGGFTEHIMVYADRPCDVSQIARWLAGYCVRSDGTLYMVNRMVIGWHVDTYMTPAECRQAIASVKRILPGVPHVGVNVSPGYTNLDYAVVGDFVMDDRGGIR